MLDPRSDPHFLSAGIREEAERLAGTRGDFAQRAAVCHHLYAHSFGNHAYPLVAAHFSLWAGLYLKRIRRSAQLLKWESLTPARRRRRLEALARLEEAIGEIGRLAFIESYHIYRLAEHRQARALVREILPLDLSEQIEDCHLARRSRRKLRDGERRAFFAAFAEWQDRAVIQPAVGTAFEAFDWEPIKKLPLQPPIRLRYFSRRDSLPLAPMAAAEDRIRLALQAFDVAEQAGWQKVEASLRSAPVMPLPFQQNSGQHFFGLQNHARQTFLKELLAGY